MEVGEKTAHEIVDRLKKRKPRFEKAGR